MLSTLGVDHWTSIFGYLSVKDITKLSGLCSPSLLPNLGCAIDRMLVYCNVFVTGKATPLTNTTTTITITPLYVGYSLLKVEHMFATLGRYTSEMSQITISDLRCLQGKKAALINSSLVTSNDKEHIIREYISKSTGVNICDCTCVVSAKLRQYSNDLMQCFVIDSRGSGYRSSLHIALTSQQDSGSWHYKELKVISLLYPEPNTSALMMSNNLKRWTITSI